MKNPQPPVVQSAKSDAKSKRARDVKPADPPLDLAPGGMALRVEIQARAPMALAPRDPIIAMSNGSQSLECRGVSPDSWHIMGGETLIDQALLYWAPARMDPAAFIKRLQQELPAGCSAAGPESREGGARAREGRSRLQKALENGAAPCGLALQIAFDNPQFESKQAPEALARVEEAIGRALLAFCSQPAPFRVLKRFNEMAAILFDEQPPELEAARELAREQERLDLAKITQSANVGLPRSRL